MDILIGTIKHCKRERVDVWARSASIHFSGKKVLLCLDEIVPEDLWGLSEYGFEIVHMPTKHQTNIDIMKFERHYITQRYLETIEDKTSIVLVTDTLDVVFQSNPFDWYRKNKNNKLLLGSEGVTINHEFWNYGIINRQFTQYISDVAQNDVLCAGVIMGEIETVKELMFYIFNLTRNVKSEDSEGIDQAAMQVILTSKFFKDVLQITTTTESFVVHCAVAGPTEQFHSWGFSKNYKYELPTFVDGVVVNKNNEPYCMVHQYNRVKEWNDFFKSNEFNGK